MQNDMKSASVGHEPAFQRVTFGQLLGPLRAALGHGAAWPDDFRDDEVILPRDLLDVIQASARIN